MSEKIHEHKDLANYVSDHVPEVVQAWANKMVQEGGEDPISWCVEHAKGFSSDPQAFSALVYATAYGHGKRMPRGKQ